MKYIVYITINERNNKFYIGVHKTENPESFDGYIGCGVNIFTPGSYKKSKTAFQYAVNKYGTKAFKRYTLCVFDNESDAYLLESKIVNKDFLKRPDVYNMSLGGNKGPDQSVIIYQYDLNGNFIKSWPNYKQASEFYNCSASCIENGVKTLHAAKGFFWSNTFYEKLDIKLYSKANVRDCIYEYDLDGKLVKIFKTSTDIAKEYGITTASINAAIRGEWKCHNRYFSNYKYEKFIPKPKQSYRNHSIYLYQLDGTFYKEFKSATECYKYFGDKTGSKLATAIRLNRVYYNYQVSIEKVECMKQFQYGNNKIKINQFDLNGKLIKTFNSLAQAKKEFGIGVERAIKGQLKQYKGFIFKKVNDIV